MVNPPPGRLFAGLMETTSTHPPDAGDSAPDLVTAIQEQLELELEKKKAPVDIVMVDHAEKYPRGIETCPVFDPARTKNT